MSRPVIYRVLPAGWVPLQVAERNLRDEASDLRYANEKARFAHGADCSAAADDRAQVAALLEALADNLHARWLQQGEEMPEEDRLLAEASFAFLAGDDRGLGDALPEEGVRVCGPVLGLYMRYADSASPDEPQLVLASELLAG